MGARTGHYVKRARKCGVPGVAFAVVAHAAHDTDGATVGYDTARWYCAEIAVSYRRRGKWSAPQSTLVYTPEEMRDWMDRRAVAGRTNWVIAPVASESLTLSQWWQYAESRGVTFQAENLSRRDAGESSGRDSTVRISQLVINGAPDILTYRADGIRWRWVSAGNYWPDYGSDGARDSGSSGSGERGCPRGVRLDGGRALSECLRLCAAFRGLCEWWQRIATAPLGLTAAGLAWGILRSHTDGRTLCTHECADTHRLERSAAHGGRASVWYVGGIGCDGSAIARGTHTDGIRAARSLPGPIYHLDVSSAYPAILRDEMFPCRLGPFLGDVPPREIESMCRTSGVIARVTIETDAPEYPLRRESDTIYPTGKFTTTLAGPDLVPLARAGQILKVHECATYILGRPFRGAMTALLDARKWAHDERDKDAEALAKLVAQAFSGKLSQKRGGWKRAPDWDEPGRWGQHYIISERAGKLIRYKWQCGMAYVWEQEKYPRGPHTSAYAYLTAYCRQKMRGIRELCPAKSVVAQTTDGLWVLPAALATIEAAGLLYGAGPGYLRLDKTAHTAQFFGPRHYTYDGKWVLAGYHAPTVDERDMTARYTHRTPLSQSRERGAPTIVVSVTRREPIPTELQLGRVGPDGWILAPRIYGTRIQSWPKEGHTDVDG